MTNPISVCPIWGEGFPAEGICFRSDNLLRVDDSPRTGGGYEIGEPTVNSLVKNMSNLEKAKLTTWLIDQRMQGNAQPLITEDVVNYVKRKHPLPIYERVDRLLRFIVGQSYPIGTGIKVSHSDPRPLAWSESTSIGEVDYLVSYLKDRNFLKSTSYLDSFSIDVTVDGFGHIADQATNVDLAQVFVAMWFDPSMKDAFDQGIEPAIREAGYNPYRVDRAEYIGKIDDQIIAEIRRSKFLVADFTHGEDGVRGGVYYEAGFAHGLNLPVIFMCKKDPVDAEPNYLHFDTNHYNHILWTDAADLKEKLKNRIGAVIGQGPLPPNQ